MSANTPRPLPQEFVRMLAGHPELDDLAEALAITEPSVSVRVNPLKGVVVPADAVKVPWCPDGFYLAERPQFTFDPALHQGLYYVQDASSMVLAFIAARLSGSGQPLRWLDACAAPGGKTTAIASALPPDSLLVANEFDFKRAGALLENVDRWGLPSVVVSRGDTARFRKLPGFFDVVSVDAPCSGEGMMRKEEVAVSQWSPALVRQCAALQREILANVWEALRPGGVLVYSTCTFNTVEDEDNLSWLVDELDAEPLDLGLADFPGVIGGVGTSLPCARFLPGRIDGEGLFVCVVRKPGHADAAQVSLREAKALKPVNGPDGWLKGDYVFTTDKAGTVVAFPRSVVPEMVRLTSVLDVVRACQPVAVTKGRDLLPVHSLALSLALERGAFPMADVDYPTAMAYLRGEPVRLDDAPRGIVLLTYGGRPLGFVKNLGNRANNLMPDRCRVRSANVPSVAPSVLSL